MDIEKLLQLGTSKGIITDWQKSQLLELIDGSQDEENNTSIVVRIMYYIGGLIMLIAMMTIMLQTIQHSSYLMILGLGLLYSIIFVKSGEVLWEKNEKFPAGIFYFLLVMTISLIFLDFEKMIGFFPKFSDYDKIPNYEELCRMPIMVLSFATIAISAFIQKYRKTDLLAIPTILCSGCIYLIGLTYLFKDSMFTQKFCVNTGLLFSICLFMIAFIKDRVTEADYSKWMYLFSAPGLFCGMMFVFNNYFMGKFPELTILQLQECLLCIVFFILGTLINRKLFSTIGILGIIEYILYWEFTLTQDINVFVSSTVFLITGLFILYAGVIYHRNLNKITNFLLNLFPPELKKYFPQNRKIGQIEENKTVDKLKNLIPKIKDILKNRFKR